MARTGDDEQGEYTYPPSERTYSQIGEARLDYIASPPDDEIEDNVTTRLSSKNQVTLPVAMVRRLGLKPGDELDLQLLDQGIRLERRPQTPAEWVRRLRGAMAHVPEWQTKEGIDAWVREERQSWEREWDPDEHAS